jgi:hypothetical protein
MSVELAARSAVAGRAPGDRVASGRVLRRAEPALKRVRAVGILRREALVEKAVPASVEKAAP